LVSRDKILEVLDFPVDADENPEDVVDEVSTEETEAAWRDVMGVEEPTDEPESEPENGGEEGEDTNEDELEPNPKNAEEETPNESETESLLDEKLTVAEMEERKELRDRQSELLDELGVDGEE